MVLKSDIPGVEIHAPLFPEYEDVLTLEALEFVVALAREFEPQRQALLERRILHQNQLNAGKALDFLPETADIRAGQWEVAPLPADLQDRRVEITGPVERKMIINALNSGAKVFMADFEDSSAPTWDNMIQGQINLRDAVRGDISFTTAEGKQYCLNEKTATLMVRPRGWHLPEAHLRIDGKPVSASIFDFSLYLFHNAKALLAKGSGPYFYLPKLESHLEARLWNEIFVRAQEKLGIPRGSIKATVLIETIPAAFEMDEILYELREHSAGLNCGRWDYIFSCIKKFHNRPDFVLADRAQVTMTAPFMRAYSLLSIQTCHRRNAPAIGGMAAQIPVKNNPVANELALGKVRQDKEREASDGHDGTWVAHPGLVPVARAIFDARMSTPNQIHRKRDDVQVTAADLLAFGPKTPITEAGVRTNISVGIEYLGAWLAGNGCVPINHLMEDAATAEISRSQLWQWIQSPNGKLPDGRKITARLAQEWISEELGNLKIRLGYAEDAFGVYELAGQLFLQLVTEPVFSEFLTLPAYDLLLERESLSGRTEYRSKLAQRWI